MDDTYLLALARYVEKNPAGAHLVPEAALWPWSNARAHLAQQDNVLVKVAPLLAKVRNWKNFLAEKKEEPLNDIRKHERTGRPLGAEEFIEKLEQEFGSSFKPQKPGPKGPRN